MTRDMFLSTVGPLAVLVLVGAGLARRRLPAQKLGLLALAWIAIIVIVWGVVTLAPRLYQHLDFT